MPSWTAPVDRLPGVSDWRECIYFLKKDVSLPNNLAKI